MRIVRSLDRAIAQEVSPYFPPREVIIPSQVIYKVALGRVSTEYISSCKLTIKYNSKLTVHCE
jgi:hypothetical protein